MRGNTQRTADVVEVLTRHFGRLLVDLAEQWLVLPAGGSGRRPGPDHLRRALEELGPTFIKLGQVLSTRPDLVPPRYEVELTKLQDSAPIVPTSDIVAAIETALGRPLESMFERFDNVPIAAASIGQVHAATLPDGSDVVVKVRRPGVVDRITTDLELLQSIAGTVARHSPFLQRYDPVGLAQEFATTLTDELDYPREARNTELVAAGFADDGRIHVPAVYWDTTCADVITEARIRGIKIDDVRALDAAGVNRSDLARTFADAYLSMVFVQRFFHADPHPGNVFVESDGRLAFVDFGMVGSVGYATGHGLGTILVALVATDPAHMADGLLGLGVAHEDIDRIAFERDLERLLDRYAHLPLEELHLRVLLADLMSVVRAHRLRLPSEIALLLKTVMMCEGVAAQLDPTFELVPLLLPYAAQLAQT